MSKCFSSSFYDDLKCISVLFMMMGRRNILETVETFSAAFPSALHPFVRITLSSPSQTYIVVISGEYGLGGGGSGVGS